MFCISCVIQHAMDSYASVMIINVQFFLFLLVPSTTVQKVFLKGHSQLCDRADLDTSFVSLKSVYLNLKSKGTRRIQLVGKQMSGF